MGTTSISRTDDGGRSFTPEAVEVPVGQSVAFWSIAFSDLDHGIAVGSAQFDIEPFTREFLVQTDDGGPTWRAPSFDVTPPDLCAVSSFLLNDACISETGVRLAIGGGGFNDENRASAFVSEAHGQHWRSVADELSAAAGGNLEPAFAGVACVGARDLWVVGSRVRREDDDTVDDAAPLTILHSADGGHTWKNLASRTPLGDANAGLTDIAFADARNAWTVGYEGDLDTPHPLLLHTADGGTHWERQTLPDQERGGRLEEVAFAGPRDGMVIGQTTNNETPLVYGTTDGGRHWRTVRLPADIDQVLHVSLAR